MEIIKQQERERERHRERERERERERDANQLMSLSFSPPSSQALVSMVTVSRPTAGN